MSVFAKRLKEARLRKGLSQERLGVLAGIDEMSSSARMNQYERGKHQPDWLTAERLAAVLEVPVAFFYATSDDEAALLLKFYGLSDDARQAAIKYIEGLL
jgi:transcriptional regulator with XRE-family HTH domain